MRATALLPPDGRLRTDGDSVRALAGMIAPVSGKSFIAVALNPILSACVRSVFCTVIGVAFVVPGTTFIATLVSMMLMLALALNTSANAKRTYKISLFAILVKPSKQIFFL